MVDVGNAMLPIQLIGWIVPWVLYWPLKEKEGRVT
jgi:hypothetical protein